MNPNFWNVTLLGHLLSIKVKAENYILSKRILETQLTKIIDIYTTNNIFRQAGCHLSELDLILRLRHIELLCRNVHRSYQWVCCGFQVKLWCVVDGDSIFM